MPCKKERIYTLNAPKKKQPLKPGGKNIENNTNLSRMKSEYKKK